MAGRADIKQRIEELAGYLACGGSSAALGGSNLWVHLTEGAGVVGGGGGGGSQFAGYGASARIAATARAIEDGLDAREQRTVFVVFFAGHAGRDLQATVLGIRKAALMRRLTIIYQKLIRWFSAPGKARRAAEHSAAADAALVVLADQYVQDARELARLRAEYWAARTGPKLPDGVAERKARAVVYPR